MIRPVVCPICMHFIQDGDMRYTAHKEGLVHAECYKGECYAEQEQFDHDIVLVRACINHPVDHAALDRIEKYRPRK